jgi:hypothetical protein
MTLLRTHQCRQRSLVLRFRIEGDQPFGLGGAEQTLVGRDEDQVVPLMAQVLRNSQGQAKDDGIGGIDRVRQDVGDCSSSSR